MKVTNGLGKSESGYMQQVKARVELGVQVRVKVGDYAERDIG